MELRKLGAIIYLTFYIKYILQRCNSASLMLRLRLNIYILFYTYSSLYKQ